jgi:hypothetical protein
VPIGKYNLKLEQLKLKVLIAVEGLPGNMFTNEHFLELGRDLKNKCRRPPTLFVSKPR